MKRSVTFDIVRQNGRIDILAFRFLDEHVSEFGKFLSKFPQGTKHGDDVDRLVRWLDKIAETGCPENKFRWESKIKYRIKAIPDHQDTSKLRLYLIKVLKDDSQNILILGNGGLKNSRTYNSNYELNSYVRTLELISEQIIGRIKGLSIEDARNLFLHRFEIEIEL